jgi:uncharacterized protein (DUF1800 family)
MMITTEKEKSAHLLNRFGLGASPQELEEYAEGGHKKTIERLLDYESRVDPFDDINIKSFANNNGNINVLGFQRIWLTRLLVTNRPLEQRMTIFWHDHFATSAQKVDIPPTMYKHINLLRRNCLGSFRDLLGAVSKDPAMIYWLDNNLNVKGRPNENFAREVMELFTLGVGHYTEEDILEAARAFTGWNFGVGQGRQMRRRARPVGNARFMNIQRDHDADEKTVLGRRGNFDGDDILDILCKEKQTARYIALKMWEFFAYPNPSVRLLETLTEKFYVSGLSIRVLVKAIMESEEFYSDKAALGVIKDPCSFCIGSMRASGAMETILKTAVDSEENRGFRAAPAASSAAVGMKSMGMDLMFPPDVSGWAGGDSWISSATMVERMKWAPRLFSGFPPNRQQRLNTAHEWLGQQSDPEKAVDALLERFGGAKLGDKKQTLVDAAAKASGGRIRLQNSVGVCLTVLPILFASPEFQFS